MKIVFRIQDVVHVFSYGRTLNDKIEADKKRVIVQTLTFSRKQYEMILEGNERGMKAFYSKADTNCLDCPFNEFGKCYTHKYNQYTGFVSMLKSIVRGYGAFDNIPEFNAFTHRSIVQKSAGKYVRFGTYGEPSLHPIELIVDIIDVAKNHTGYTHQWSKRPELGSFFMASTHTAEEEKTARSTGYRSFIATDKAIDGAVNCPASAEAGYKSTCSKCGLCSGMEGKGNKSIYIMLH